MIELTESGVFLPVEVVVLVVIVTGVSACIYSSVKNNSIDSARQAGELEGRRESEAARDRADRSATPEGVSASFLPPPILLRFDLHRCNAGNQSIACFRNRSFRESLRKSRTADRPLHTLRKLPGSVRSCSSPS